jgi:hypothetical protein
VSFGPAAIINKDLCLRARNFISKKDPVSALSDQESIDSYPDVVHYLECDPDANHWFDHKWQSPTYRRPARNNIEWYIGKYRKDGK